MINFNEFFRKLGNRTVLTKVSSYIHVCQDPLVVIVNYISWLSLLHNFILLKSEFRTGLDFVSGAAEVRDSKNLWQWSRPKIKLN